MKKKIGAKLLLLLVIISMLVFTMNGMGEVLDKNKKVDQKKEMTKNEAAGEKKEQEEKTEEKKEESAKKEESKKPKGSSNQLLELFKLGGPFMWPLFIFSIIVIAVILERAVVYSGIKFRSKNFGQRLIVHLKKANFDEAVKYCELNKNNVASDIFCKSIPAFKRSSKDFEKSVDASASVKVSRLEKNLNILATMGNIAPLTGFLGTVSGMITAFKTIALSDNVTARLVAGGIYEALITTAFGLIIAIVAVAANNFFVHKVDSAVSQIEETANLMIESVKQREA